MNRPLPDAKVLAVFGDPRPYMLVDGSIGPGWERHQLGIAKLPAPLPLAWDGALVATKFRCHRLLAPAFESVMLELFNHPAAWATIGDFGGCYEFRKQRNGGVLSRHSWGIAIDLDVADNPFGREPKVHPEVLATFESHGFAWGGYFSQKRRDGMHFEVAQPLLERLGLV